MPNHFFKRLKNLSRLMPVDKELVRQKLKRIIADIEKIRVVLEKISYEAMVTDEATMTIIERRLERVINRSLDINLHVIRSLAIPPPDDYKSSFSMLAEHAVLTKELSLNIAPCVGTRNILVHEYDDLNTMQFYEALKNAIELFPKYVQEIEAYISKF